MTEKYSLLPLNPQQLTPVQTAIQKMSEKHPDFEIEPVNTIQPLEIKYMSCVTGTASSPCEPTCLAPLRLEGLRVRCPGTGYPD